MERFKDRLHFIKMSEIKSKFGPMTVWLQVQCSCPYAYCVTSVGIFERSLREESICSLHFVVSKTISCIFPQSSLSIEVSFFCPLSGPWFSESLLNNLSQIFQRRNNTTQPLSLDIRSTCLTLLLISLSIGSSLSPQCLKWVFVAHL